MRNLKVMTYTKAVIGETITLNDSEQKVLGLRWDSMEDELPITFERGCHAE